MKENKYSEGKANRSSQAKIVFSEKVKKYFFRSIMFLLCNKKKRHFFQAIKLLYCIWGKLEKIFGFVPTMFKEISKQSQ